MNPTGACSPARLGDLDVSSSTYGGVIPLGFGVQKVAGTIIWATDIEEEKRRRTEGEGRVPLLQPVSSHAAR